MFFRTIIFLLISNSLFAYNIQPNNITVSGISSGAHFAAQYHLSHSDKIGGLALIAGGPYYCSYFNISKVLYNCMEGKGNLNTDNLVTYTKYLSASNLISSYKNLENDKIYLLAGKNDQTVVPDITISNFDFYRSLNIKEENIKIVDELPIGHAFPTKSYGNDCETPQAKPFISACRYDGAKEIFKHLIEGRLRFGRAKSENLFTISQQPFSQYSIYLSSYSIANEGFLYVPTSCQNGKECKLHIAFHGCEMSYSVIGKEFIENAGFNRWAERNNIIVYYPQTIRNNFIGNPHGCWDWWGYTGPHFMNKLGYQIRIIDHVVNKISDPEFSVKDERFSPSWDY